MKIRITTLLLALVTSMSFGQLTFVKEINFRSIHAPLSSLSLDGNTNNIIESGKYILAEPQHNNSWGKQTEYQILDTDYNLYKKIVVDTSHNENGVIRISGPWISDHLFNSDDKIEYTYTLYLEYEDTVNGWGTESKLIRTVIVDEDNNILQYLDKESFSMDDFYLVDSKTYVKLKNTQGTTKVYKVDGSMPCIQCSSSLTRNSKVKAPAPTYSFTLFPNPTDGPMSITTDLNEANMQVKIYSTSGQLLQSGVFFTGSNSVDVSSLAAGTYVINITSDKGFLHTEQFVKK